MKNILFLLLLGAVFQVSVAQTVFINEIHYDNSSTDSNEGFEIAGPAGTDLTNWSVVLYNGSNGKNYGTVNLTGTLANESNGFGFEFFAKSGIQNGGPDGLALVNNLGVVVQFLSYEGSFSATDGVANGLTSSDIGVSESSSSTVGHSLQLSGSGTVASDFTWQGSSASSYGSVNTGQTFSSGGPITFVISNFEIISNHQIKIKFSKKLKSPLTDFSVVFSSLTNISETVEDDSILVLNFDAFVLGTTQSIEISKDIKSIDDETLAANISETFLFNNSTPNLVISEIMYNNAASSTTQDNLEFLEFYNNSSATIQLGGFEMSVGVTYTFPEGTSLAPNAFYIICENATEFETAFGFANVPEWSGSLSNSGEALTLINTEGTIIDNVQYDDGGNWPNEADGDGPSLEIINPNNDNNDASNWRASDGFVGLYDDEITYASPYSLQGTAVAPLSVIDFKTLNANEIQVVFSTVLDSASLDLNELTGLGSNLLTTELEYDSILTISLNSPLIIGTEYTVDIAKAFAKDTNGLNLISSYDKTFIFNNSTPDLVISEIMYNLPGDDSGLEFLELYNNSDSDINISGFYFESGVEYQFPVGSIIPAREFFLIGEDGAMLTSLFSVPFVSWTSKNLSNSGELVSINNSVGVEIDRVEYDETSPWPTAANGDGSSLEIINFDLDNNVASNWRASTYYAITIGDNDILASPGALEITTKSVFYFTSDSLSFFEGETGKIQIHLKNAEKLDTRANVVIGSATATENKDFTLVTTNVRYEGLETIFDVEFVIHKDYTKENEEYFELKLQSPKYALISASNGSAKIKIKDTDQGSAEVCINEVNRNSTTTSPTGNDVPFIELANVDFYSENLARYTLKAESEDTTVLFQLRNYTSVRANNFATIWLEESASFDGLRSVMFSGREIQLSLIKDNILVNSAIVPTLSNTEIYARVFDCDDVFEKRAVATPNWSNNNVSIFENASYNNLAIYPNPAHDFITFSNTSNYIIYNSIGVVIKEITHANQTDISDLPQGIYLVKADSGENGRFVKQ
jgi:hypothetical protein